MDSQFDWESNGEREQQNENDVSLSVQKSVCTVCVAAGSGQLTAIAEFDLLDELDWAEPHTAVISVCVCVGGK